jgi:hypothetical protein
MMYLISICYGAPDGLSNIFKRFKSDLLHITKLWFWILILKMSRTSFHALLSNPVMAKSEVYEYILIWSTQKRTVFVMLRAHPYYVFTAVA